MRFLDPDGMMGRDGVTNKQVDEWEKFGQQLENKSHAEEGIAKDRVRNLAKTMGSGESNLQIAVGVVANEKESKSFNNTSNSAKFFSKSKEADAYKYMWNESNKTDEQVEVFAWVTKEGVFVLPTEGVTTDGEKFKNNASTSQWDVMPLKREGNKLYIKYGDRFYEVIASVHTHPAKYLDAAHSGDDASVLLKRTNVTSIVLSNTGIYGMNPTSKTSVRITPDRSDFEKGRISVIKNFQQIKNFINNYQ